jgi:hypothetical protein
MSIRESCGTRTKKSTVVETVLWCRDAGYPALGPQQPQQGASSHMPLAAQTERPRRASQRRPSSASPGLAWQPMPYTRPRPYQRASAPTARPEPQSRQVPGNLSVIVLAIVFTSVFNLLLVYRTQRTLSRVNVDGKDDVDPPHSKGKLRWTQKNSTKKSRATFTPWDSSLDIFECKVKAQGIWVSLDLLVVYHTTS